MEVVKITFSCRYVVYIIHVTFRIKKNNIFVWNEKKNRFDIPACPTNIYGEKTILQSSYLNGSCSLNANLTRIQSNFCMQTFYISPPNERTCVLKDYFKILSKEFFGITYRCYSIVKTVFTHSQKLYEKWESELEELSNSTWVGE